MENTVRKVNYMEIKTVIWDQHGYKHLGLTRQIPRDQATCVEKSLENSQRVGRRHLDAREEKKFIQNIIVISENIPEEKNANQDDQVQTHLHNTQSISPLGSANNLPIERGSACFDWKVEGIVCSSISQPGKNVYQEIDTRTKERTTKSDIENINKSVMELKTGTAYRPLKTLLAICGSWSALSTQLLLPSYCWKARIKPWVTV